jgi:hypothetical protein
VKYLIPKRRRPPVDTFRIAFPAHSPFVAPGAIEVENSGRFGRRPARIFGGRRVL